jgi:hypothetical protein
MIKQKVIKQKKREQNVGWREREMFVDKSRFGFSLNPRQQTVE